MTKPVAALLSCVKSKKGVPCEAQDLYVSPLFKLSKAYALQYGLPVYVPSAKYKLVPGTRIIAPYEKTLNEMTHLDVDQWSRDVAESIRMEFDRSPLLVLAGSSYLGFSKYVDNTIINPLAGLAIGKRLQWLKQNTK
jgi:hypothetical protein